MRGIRTNEDADDIMTEPANGFHAPLPEELAPLFPSYQILSLVAKGGMGAVYHAIQTSLEREVAIKILPAEFGDDRGFCESFEAEAKAMARLNHPNLISVYDFGEVNGMLFIVMEYVPGQSLHEACDGAAVDPAEAIRLMIAISRGLAHAHEHGILHRDIKPANILLDSHLRPKIGDFGLARPLDAQVREGEAIFGTPGYTAPEVLEPPHTVDQRADIFSLGVLLHELLTGLVPGTDPRPPSAISYCDPRFDAVVHKATHPSPRQRYQNAAEIADELGKIATTAGPRVLRTASPAAPGRPAALRPPAALGYSAQSSKKGNGGMMGALVAVAGIVAFFIFKDRIFPGAGPSPDPAPVVENQPEPVQPGPVAPEPVQPEPGPVQPDPGPVASVPEPVKPEDPWATAPGPVGSDPEPVEPEPGPVASAPGTEPGDPSPVPAHPPKFDVEAFLTHARSVMITRCGPEIVKHDEALRKNLADFQSDGGVLIKENLEEVYHAAGTRELAEFVERQKANGNRMGEGLEKPLKFKKWLVALHEEYRNKEARIDGEMTSAFAEQEKTYLYGLQLKLKALQEADDPGAVGLIKAEIEKVTASPDYFAGLMGKKE